MYHSVCGLHIRGNDVGRTPFGIYDLGAAGKINFERAGLKTGHHLLVRKLCGQYVGAVHHVILQHGIQRGSRDVVESTNAQLGQQSGKSGIGRLKQFAYLVAQ